MNVSATPQWSILKPFIPETLVNCVCFRILYAVTNSLERIFTSILKHTNLCCLFEWCSHYSGETTFTFSLLLQPFWLQSPSKFIPCLPWSDCNQDWFAPKYDILLLITQQHLLTLHPSATTIHNNSIKRPTIEIWVGYLNSFRLTCFNLTLCSACIVHYFFFS